MNLSDLRRDRLQRITNYLAEVYKDEIIWEGDWWYGLKKYSINIFDYEDKKTGWFTVNVYNVDPVTGMDNSSMWFDLDQVFVGHATSS
jgi:hypothetical protein